MGCLEHRAGTRNCKPSCRSAAARSMRSRSWTCSSAIRTENEHHEPCLAVPSTASSVVQLLTAALGPAPLSWTPGYAVIRSSASKASY